MKQLFKILLVPVIVGLAFVLISGLLWCVGSLLLYINISLLPVHGYSLAGVITIGGLHLLVLFITLLILIGVYNAVNDVF